MTEVDAAACADEPIHIPGSIQPHGALIGVTEPDLEIVLASANAAQVLGRDIEGMALEELFDGRTVTTLRAALDGDPRDVNPLGIGLSDGGTAHGLVHRSDGLLLIEIEPAGDDDVRFRTAYRRLVRRFDRLRRAASIDEVVEIAAAEIAALTGFDRVMVYRFDVHANGEVIAERRADEQMEPFMGLHYPASDIPAQARRLYIENPVRLIVDAGYTPVPLCPERNPLTGKPLDLSGASLRSVSPVHCEYLRNMGVGASMSISLLNRDELWGLIACHHRTPFHVPYATRLIAEFLAHVLSARIVEIERLEALTLKNAAYAVQARLIDEMVAAPRFQDGLAGDGPTLSDLIGCDGSAVLFRGEVTRIGVAPAEQAIRELGAAIAAQQGNEVVVSDCLTDVHEPAREYADIAAGVIAVPLSVDGADLIFWFRRERAHSVTWAGNPNKAVVSVESDSQLRPRASFEAWVEQVRGCSVPWADWEIEVASDFRTALVASIIHQAAELERLNTRLLQASQTKDQFLATVSHELRNPLNAITGWVRIARMGLEGDELDHALETIERNAVAQAALIDDLLDIGRVESGRINLETRPLNLASLVRMALDTVEPSARSKQIEIRTSLNATEVGSEIVGDPRRLQQVVWNLLTNAIKFSPERSRIDVDLSRSDSQLALTVSDQGSGIEPELMDTIFEPFRQGKGPGHRSGLGLGLSIVKSIVELHGGGVEAASDGRNKGARFTVRLPVSALRMEHGRRDLLEYDSQIDLEGRSILVAEDNPDAAEMVATVLSTLGAEVTTATDGAEALALLRDGADAHLLISDLEMPNLDGFGLVTALRADPDLDAIPAIALTAFTRGGDRARALASGFQHHVSKPVDPDELVVVVASVLDRLG